MSPPASEAPPAPALLRLVVSVDGTVRRVHPVVGEEIALGRGADCELMLEDALVSRRHCRFYHQHGRLWLEDLKSANGTYVNGRTIDRVPFGPGDRAEVGPFQVTLEEVSSESARERTRQPLDRPGGLPVAPSGQELAILLSLLESIDAELPRAQAQDKLLGSLLRAMQAARAFLFRWDSRRGTARCEVSHVAEGADRETPVSETLVRKVAKDREPYLVTDLLQRGDDAPPSLSRLAHGNVQSIIVAPLSKGRKLIGILYLDSPAARKSFTAGDLDLLSRASSFLAGLLDSMEAREELAAENKKLKDAVASGAGDIPIGELVSVGSPMAPVVELIRRAASRDVTVLLTGETGTGKEVAARALHRLSSRARGRFIAINCGAIPESLIESELFGYKKGAFSGAVEDRAGLVEMAHQGTLFLDEVGELPASAQVRLLRVLEERQVVRLGSSDPVPVDFRLLAATHRDLAARADDGSFRTDLFYRLNVFPIVMPPLRDRLVDLPLLVEFLIGTVAARLGVPVTGAAPDLVPALATYTWPGNVRELRNVLERALVLEDSPLLTARSLPVELRARATRPAAPPSTPAAAPHAPAVSAPAAAPLPSPAILSPGAPSAPASTPRVKIKAGETGGLRPWNDIVRELERVYLKQLVAQVGSNVAAMARVSGLSRLTLYRKLGQLGLEVPGGDPGGDAGAGDPDEPGED